jgi:uncharacterized membrane protein
MRIRTTILSLLIVSSFVIAASCKRGDDEGEGGLPACPKGGTQLTYDNFGKQFFIDYCSDCHVSGSNVSGAEPFETQSQIQDEADEIYNRAGGTNDNMPQSGPQPTADERQKLAEWLSCGAK